MLAALDRYPGNLSVASFRRSLVAKAALLSASVLLSLLAGEAALRFWFHAAPQLELDLYNRDSKGNLRLRPGISRRHVTALWDVAIEVNSHGWRDRETPSSPSGAVLGLGDSMAFGWGVPLEDSLYFQLEEQLRPAGEVTIVKAAVPGTGPSDQQRLLETLWPQYQPAAVILTFFVGNDFVDVQMGGAEQFVVEDGLLIRRPLAGQQPSLAQAGRAKLLRSSHLLQFLRAVQLNWSRTDGSPRTASEPRRWDEWLREFAQIHRRDYPERTARAVEQTLACLDRMVALCQSRSAPFLLVIVPRSYQVYPKEQRELLDALGLPPEQIDLDRPQRLLGEWAASRQVEAVDLLPTFRRHYEQNPDATLFYYPDAHMNAQGHRLAAQAILASGPARQSLLDSSLPGASR
jgi:hypothetical protein